jgi:hypothetical protein
MLAVIQALTSLLEEQHMSSPCGLNFLTAWWLNSESEWRQVTEGGGLDRNYILLFSFLVGDIGNQIPGIVHASKHSTTELQLQPTSYFFLLLLLFCSSGV